MASSAERQRRWRLAHPEQAAQNLAKIIGKPRRKKPPVTVPPDDEDTLHGNAETMETDDVTENVTETGEGEHKEPEPPALDVRVEVLGYVAELESIRLALQVSLPPAELTRLRLRMDVLTRLISATERLGKLPVPEVADDWLKAYHDASRERLKPPKAKRKAQLSPSYSPETAFAGPGAPGIATEPLGLRPGSPPVPEVPENGSGGWLCAEDDPPEVGSKAALPSTADLAPTLDPVDPQTLSEPLEPSVLDF